MQPLLQLPGPKAKATIIRDQQVISPSYPRDYPFVIDYGRGAEVGDVDGNRYLDFTAGIAPPLSISREESDQGLMIFEDVITLSEQRSVTSNVA